MTTDVEIEVHVTEALIRGGISRDCNRCAVALALCEATGDTNARVAEVDWRLRLVVRGRYIAAPVKVVQLVDGLDRLERDADGRPILPRKLEGIVSPFRFAIPPLDADGWQDACDGCEELFDPADIDNEGYCQGCRKAADSGPS